MLWHWETGEIYRKSHPRRKWLLMISIPKQKLILQLRKRPEKQRKRWRQSHKPIVDKPSPPFPKTLQKWKDNPAYNFMDILKQVQIHIILVEIWQELPKYAKYIRDIVENKHMMTEFETIALIEEYSSRIQSKLPPKLKDWRSFTIQISIGKHVVRSRVLCVVEANINLIPLFMFWQLGLGDPQPTTVVLQLADRSLANLDGLIKDILVQVGRPYSSWFNHPRLWA